MDVQRPDISGGEPETPPNDALRGSADWWDGRYRKGEIPWDTGIVPPEVVAWVTSGRIAEGWALDLGCGSGVSSRYLARHGFRVLGIDLALSALARARSASARDSLGADFCAGDVADLSFARVIASLALDVGCFHTLAPDRRQAYTDSLASHITSGGYYLLYAFEDGSGRNDVPGIGPREIASLAPYFTLLWARHGLDQGRPSAWYLFRRSNRQPPPSG
jgi:SAM-dependent methyltransferase